MRFILLLASAILLASPQSDKNLALLDAIHKGDHRAIRAALKAGADPNAKDEIGSTALMHAAAYASEADMQSLIAAGANVNAASAAGFTPLMWSVSGPAKLRLLLRNHANPLARAKGGYTAVILARQNGHDESARLLVAAGAEDDDGMDRLSRPLLKLAPDLSREARSIGILPMHFAAASGPLFVATYLSVPATDVIREIIELGTDVNKNVEMRTLSLSPLAIAANFGNLPVVRLLLERGANPNAKGSRGMTPLMAAAASETQPGTAIVEALLERGAEVNTQDGLGRSALDWALLMGESKIARHLRAAGGKPMWIPSSLPSAVFQPRDSGEAVEKALALLLPSGPAFFKGSGCISCHNNSLIEIAARRALANGLAINRSLADHPTKAAMAMWRPLQENLAVGATSVPGLIANIGFELTAMADGDVAANFVTDAATLALARLQRSDGSWMIADQRPPLGVGAVMWTALAARAVAVYMPAGRRSEMEERVRRARSYLLEVKAVTTQDEVFQLLGLRWTSAPDGEIRKHRDALLGLQREDGGWSQLAGMSSDAYATGQSLFALTTAGLMHPDDMSYQRGIRYLLRTQLQDGSWYVRSRAVPFQPYQETGFPHGRDQFISSAATSWAVIGLAPTIHQRAQAQTGGGIQGSKSEAASR
jgi:ankyrin repeat protein